MLGEMSVAQTDAPHRSSDENTGQRGRKQALSLRRQRRGAEEQEKCGLYLQARAAKGSWMVSSESQGHSGQPSCRASRKYGDLQMREVECPGMEGLGSTYQARGKVLQSKGWEPQNGGFIAQK